MSSQEKQAISYVGPNCWLVVHIQKGIALTRGSVRRVVSDSDATEPPAECNFMIKAKQKQFVIQQLLLRNYLFLATVNTYYQSYVSQ